MLSSTDNEKVKLFKKIRNTKYIKTNKLFIVEGEHLVVEAIKKNIVKYILIKEDYDYSSEYEVIKCSEKVMKYISTLDSVPYIMAVCNLIEEKEEIGNKIVILDNVSDPGNIGTIIRNSVAFNIDTIILSNESVNKYNDKLIRSSQGMIFHINIISLDILEALNKIKNKNIEIIGTSLHTDIYLNNLKHLEKYAVVLGNEGKGISDKVLNECSQLVKIKINNNCESLNVAVASGIILNYLEG